MSSLYNNGAMESMFDAEQTTATLLESVKVNVAEKVKTVDAAASLENKLSEEAAQFNACLTTMSNSIRKCERGEISREEMLAECAPCVSTLKEKCVALTLSDVKATGDDITEEEIAMLKEYIVGCKDIVADRKRELQDCPIEGKAANEGLLAGLSNFEPATEAGQIAEIRKSTEAKTAAQLYNQAKKLYGLGSKDKALKYLKDAQKLYEKCLAKVEKASNMYKSERTVKYGGIEDKFDKNVTDNYSGASAIAYFEDRIDSCKALELQWQNKAGKSTFKETKDQLRLERKKIKAGKKAAAKASKSAKKYADAAYKEKMANATSEEDVEAVESIFELMYATEAFADELLMDYDLSAAFEAEGDVEAEGEGTGVSENEQKLRELYEQFNEAKAANDTAKMDQLTGEINKVIDKIAKEAEDAYSAEDLKAADRKLAKGLAIGAAVVATAAAIGVGVKTGAFKKVAEAAKAQAAKLKSNKGENKGETKKGEGALKGIKTALSGLKGKFKLGKKKEATEATIDGMDFAEFEASMESLMDSYELDLAIEAAMEAEGEEGEAAPKSASGIGAKLRKAFGKLKKAKAEDDTNAIREAEKEVNEAADELAEAAENAETPEEKSKLGKALKIGLAAAGVAAAAVGAVAIASKASKAADAKADRGFELNNGEKLLRKAASAIRTTKGNASQMAGNVKDSIGEVGNKAKNAALAAKFMNKKYKASESFLESLAFGLEGVTVEGEDVDDDEVEPAEGKSFDDEDLTELAAEAAIAVMAAEDGIDDSDLD